ncbi:MULTISPECIES: Fic family protein [unclassified Leptotrichia]|uniref:Fic family protein n=1 Tax=unclassified Leptotrichia TaxID=2633022 RepID=UPI0003AE6C9F|nr:MULTISPECIES: Fic family protein [unclassified Leptotrichia]ERL25855.1 Fic family protein [Leptotrichia sp. oral taxon 225 str. F0581]WLD73766.1 Fic family protein [Leptotrichia sp. HMT-225]
MNNYLELSKLYYQKANIEEELNKRLENPCVYKTSLYISPILRGERVSEEVELFFLPIKNVLMLQDEIIQNSRDILNLSNELPKVALNYCIREIMVNEIIKSNGIEGVHTTKKDVYDSMNSNKKYRFSGIIKKYKQITENKIEKINSAEEIRKIYDEVFSEEIMINPENQLDGKLFRKGLVYVTDSSMKNVHLGDSNEDLILKHIQNLIIFMNKKDINFLLKACITHYYFEYIHPFYDGNGRFGRLIFSMYLARKLDVFTGLSLSYAIFSEKEKYSKLFLNTSNSKNFGEITFFLIGMLELIKKGQESIIKMLEDKIEKLNFSRNYLNNLNLSDLEKDIMFVYIQNHIFSNSDLEDKELCKIINMSRPTLKNNIEQLIKKEYLTKISKKPITHVLSDKLQKVID